MAVPLAFLSVFELLIGPHDLILETADASTCPAADLRE